MRVVGAIKRSGAAATAWQKERQSGCACYVAMRVRVESSRLRAAAEGCRCKQTHDSAKGCYPKHGHLPAAKRGGLAAPRIGACEGATVKCRALPVERLCGESSWAPLRLRAHGWYCLMMWCRYSSGKAARVDGRRSDPLPHRRKQTSRTTAFSHPWRRSRTRACPFPSHTTCRRSACSSCPQSLSSSSRPRTRRCTLPSPSPVETVLTRMASLSIKSLPPAASGTSNAKPAYAVLCTPSKAFQLRQVQTSNSLFVTRSTLDAHGDAIPAPTTCAIASCTATLELHPAVESAVPYLEDALPVYHVVGGEVDAEENRRSKASVFSDVPLSDGQCEKAWNELVGFELNGSSYRPSADTLAKVWQSINAAALAEGIKLNSQFLTNDLTKLVVEEGHAASLATAMLRHLANADEDMKEEWSSLDRTRTVAFVGKTTLDARGGKPDFLTAEFLHTWRDCLPEVWRADAELKAIDGAYTLPSSTTICAKGKIVATTTPAAAAKGKGKWHERLGKNRKK
jgi:sister chromatid cohesion protein DCC1